MEKQNKTKRKAIENAQKTQIFFLQRAVAFRKEKKNSFLDYFPILFNRSQMEYPHKWPKLRNKIFHHKSYTDTRDNLKVWISSETSDCIQGYLWLLSLEFLMNAIEYWDFASLSNDNICPFVYANSSIRKKKKKKSGKIGNRPLYHLGYWIIFYMLMNRLHEIVNSSPRNKSWFSFNESKD